jgi:hypothetical protein
LPIVGAGLCTYRRRYISSALAAVALVCGVAADLGAQARRIEVHPFSDPEGRLLAFYSAAMSFTPAGFAPDESRIAFTLEASYVPYLNEEQRRPSIDKPESTNLAPFFPRPRLGVRLGSWLMEGSWIPPMEVFDVTANLLSASVSGPSARVGSIDVAPRVWGTLGRVKGAMTCSPKTMVGHGADLELYYATVCHNRESDDWFEPRVLGGEAVASFTLGGSSRMYATVGARYDRTRFDIGVITVDGERDQDHPILELDTFRPQGAIGASWSVTQSLATGGELFYAPGSLLTVRISGRWILRQ